MAPTSEINQDILPIQLPMQSIHMSRRRTSRIMTRSETTAAGSAHKHIELDISSPTVSTFEEQAHHQLSMLARLSRMITRAGKEERLHYHHNGGPHQHHHHHHHHHRHSHGHGHSPTTPPSLKKQLFAKATVVTLEKKYATVHWAGEFSNGLSLLMMIASDVCATPSPSSFCLSLPSLIKRKKKKRKQRKKRLANSISYLFLASFFSCGILPFLFSEHPSPKEASFPCTFLSRTHFKVLCD